MDLTSALQNVVNPDLNARHQAEQFLAQLQAQSLPVYLVQLVMELANEQKPGPSRQQAGLQLKNLLESKDAEKRQLLAQQWTQLKDDVKAQIRQQVLSVLHSPTAAVRRTAAQVVSSIASIDLPQNQWLNVVTELVNNVTQPRDQFAVESSLQALGYLCEECRTPSLMAQSNPILTAVIQGMRPEQTNVEIRLAATEALLSTLEFVKQNFEREGERNFIMQVTCQATVAEDERIRIAAMQCLVKIASLYYEYLKPYINALFDITVKAAKAVEDSDDVALQAVEFWSTIAEMESEIIDELRFAAENNEQSDRQIHNFVGQALKPLVEMLFHLMVRQEEDQTDEDWNPSIAAGKCLSLIAKVVNTAIVQCAMPYIAPNIKSNDWHYREAATLAFSAILEGPDPSAEMNKLINEAIPLMLPHVADPVTIVKDTTVFTLGRIAQFHQEPLINNHLENVLAALTNALADPQALVASKASWAIHNIAEAFEGEEESDKPSNALSKYFPVLAQTLLKVTARPDIGEANMRVNSYGAFATLVNSAARDQYQYLIQLVPHIMTQLGLTIDAFQKTPDNKTREELTVVQGFLCSTLQGLAQKLKESIRQFSDDMMKLFLQLFQVNRGAQEEVLLAIGTLATSLSDYFERYMQHFLPCLLEALKARDHYQICTVAVSVVGDLCTSLERKMVNYSDRIMEVLLTNLQDPTINRTIKPVIISIFGDVAMAIGGQFDRYMKYVAMILKQASEAQVDPRNEDMVDYLNQLRENIFEAYSGILQGLKKENIRAFDPCVDNLLAFLRLVAKDQSIDEVVFRGAVNVIGDLANVYGSKIKGQLSSPEILDMVKDATKAHDKETKNIAKWTMKELQRL